MTGEGAEGPFRCQLDTLLQNDSITITSMEGTRSRRYPLDVAVSFTLNEGAKPLALILGITTAHDGRDGRREVASSCPRMMPLGES